MPDQIPMRQRAAQQLYENRKALSQKMAAGRVPVDGTVPVSSAEERKMYWQRAITAEEELMTWQGIIQEGLAEGLDEQGAIARAVPRVAIAVYPARSALLNQGDRARGVPGWVERQIAYANKHEKMGPPDAEGEDDDG